MISRNVVAFYLSFSMARNRSLKVKVEKNIIFGLDGNRVSKLFKACNTITFPRMEIEN